MAAGNVVFNRFLDPDLSLDKTDGPGSNSQEYRPGSEILQILNLDPTKPVSDTKLCFLTFKGELK